MAARIVVTDHARLRWRQRAARRLGMQDLEGIVRSAWRRGAKARRSKRNERGERRVYMGWVFVFERGPGVVALLTVIPPPHG